MIVSDAIGSKALRLVGENRVMPWQNASGEHGAMVSGDTGYHRVIARPDSVWCDCQAWKEDRWCSHAIASMLVWYEMLSTRQLAG